MRISDWSSDVCSSDLASHRLQPAVFLVFPLKTDDFFGRDKGEPMGLGNGLVGHLATGHVQPVLQVRVLGQRAAVALVGQRQDERQRRIVEGEGRSEEHTSELKSLMRISYDVFCLKKKIK